MKKIKIRMATACLLTGAAVLFSSFPVMADNSDVVVFTSANDNYFHIDGCKTLNGAGSQTNLQAALDQGLDGCPTCAANQLVPAGSSQNSSSNDSGNSQNSDSNSSENSKDTITIKETSTSNIKGEEEVTIEAGFDEESTDSSKSSSKNSNDSSSSNSSSGSGNSNSSANSNSNNSSNSSSSNSSTKSNSSSSSSSSGSSKSSTSKSSVPTPGQLMTQKQRKAAFQSLTNPPRGTKPATIARPANSGFYYADFAIYNSYNSENHMGGTPIYLLGTIMQMEPVSESGNNYSVAMMVNDCDGYQWYMRINCNKAKYGLMKAELIGKAANIFGTYAGYSGVTNRPMMDATMVFEVGGNAINLAIYQ